MSPLRPLAATLCGLALCACQASVQGKLEIQSPQDAEEVHDFDKPLEAPPVKVEPVSSDEFTVEQFALLGARHDLRYAGPKEPTCRCLAVSLTDRTAHPSLAWDLSAPRLQPTTQWVIALSSEDLTCDGAPGATLGASYQGYEVIGNDVVVYVEALGAGRPLASGAVIPKPLADGSVYIEASGSVYGQPVEGAGQRCKIRAEAQGTATASR